MRLPDRIFDPIITQSGASGLRVGGLDSGVADDPAQPAAAMMNAKVART